MRMTKALGQREQIRLDDCSPLDSGALSQPKKRADAYNHTSHISAEMFNLSQWTLSTAVLRCFKSSIFTHTRVLPHGHVNLTDTTFQERPMGEQDMEP